MNRSVFLLSLAAGACAASGYSALVEDFDDVEVGNMPAGWSVAETNGQGAPATWRVGQHQDGGCMQLASTKNGGQTYNILFAPEEHDADVAVSVRLRADSGEEDQGGGIVWRAQDADNYYIVRWNPLEDNLRVYKVIDAWRTQLASAEVTVGPGWHALEVSMRGLHLVVHLDGEQQLEIDDDSIQSGGQIGLWTKADAATSFDEFRVVRLGD